MGRETYSLSLGQSLKQATLVDPPIPTVSYFSVTLMYIYNNLLKFINSKMQFNSQRTFDEFIALLVTLGRVKPRIDDVPDSDRKTTTLLHISDLRGWHRKAPRSLWQQMMQFITSKRNSTYAITGVPLPPAIPHKS